MRLAKELEASGKFDNVYYPGLESNPQFELATRQQLDPNGFLVADVDWHPFANDLRIDVSAFDRGPLIKVMRRYFDLKGFETDWTQIENSDNDQLLATLSMVCPFEIAEKQALLEADTMAKRAELLIAMMEMALHNETGGNDARH